VKIDSQIAAIRAFEFMKMRLPTGADEQELQQAGQELFRLFAGTWPVGVVEAIWA